MLPTAFTNKVFVGLAIIASIALVGIIVLGASQEPSPLTLAYPSGNKPTENRPTANQPSLDEVIQSTQSIPDNTTANSPSPIQAQTQAPTQPLSKDLPPGFPVMEPIDQAEIKETEALIKEADAIIANMEELLKDVELPPLSPEQQAQLTKQQEESKAQLEQLQQELNQLQN